MKNLIYFVSFLALFSCSTKQEKTAKNETFETPESTEEFEKNETEEYDANEKINDFQSILRVGKTNWNVNEIYTDTLEFVEYNTDADYSFVLFKNSLGKEVLIYSNVWADDSNENSIFKVKWKVGEFYEAGEGDAIYYKEQLVSVEGLKSSISFEPFLSQFYEDYKTGKQSDLNSYLHPLEKLISTQKIGLYCSERDPDNPPNEENLINEYIISSEKLVGDVCEGYEGAKDGLYYEFFGNSNDLFPRILDRSNEDMNDKSLYPTEEISCQNFAKITVIKDQFVDRYLYFFKEQDRWYFWLENFCDCSA